MTTEEINVIVIQQVRMLTAELAALRFSEREWRDKAQDKIAEVERLGAALERALDHLRFNGWMNDPHSDRRTIAAREVEAALGMP